MSDDEEGLPILWVVVMLMLVIAAFGWAFAAAAYAHEVEDWGSGTGKTEALLAFAFNAFAHIPSFFQVIGFLFSKRLWLAIIFLVLEILAVFAGLGMRKIEREWSKYPTPPY